jgi:competence protein ComEA
MAFAEENSSDFKEGSGDVTPIFIQRWVEPSAELSRCGTKPNKPKPAESLAATQLLDINTATEAELRALKGVGDIRAANIIKNRPYKGKDELVQKNIIPPAVYAGIKDKIIAKQQ